MFRKNGEKAVERMTIQKVCSITGVPLPESVDGKRKAGTVYAHPALLEKGSVIFCSNRLSWKEHCYEAQRKDAALIVTYPGISDPSVKNDPRVVEVDDTSVCLTRYIKYIRDSFSTKIITITGTVGKSTTTGMFHAVFGDAFKTYKPNVIDNSREAAFRIIQGLHNNDRFYIQELGAAAPNYIGATARGLTPDAVVITNIGDAHLDKYITRERILEDKASLIENMRKGGVAFLDKDDEMLRNYQTERRVIYYALHDKTADYYAENIVLTNLTQCFDIVERRTGIRYNAQINLVGDYNVRNTLAVFAAGRHFGIAAKEILKSLRIYHPAGIRQNICNIGGHTLFLDTFNSAPNTLIGSVKALGSLELAAGGRRILVAGDIAHLGSDTEEMHHSVGVELAKEKELGNCDLLVCFGTLAKHIYLGAVESGMSDALFFDENDRESLNTWLRENIRPEDITLYKACQATNLPMTIDAVYGTTLYHLNEFVYVHETDSETDGTRIRLNKVGKYHQFKALLDKHATELTIPDDGTIRRIAPEACMKSSLTKVTIPDRIVNIGARAFFKCFALTEVQLPKNLLYIERSAFNSCVQLESVVLPEGTRHLEDRAFYDCLHLSSVTIPASVGYIGKDVFKNCKDITLHVKEDSYAHKYAQDHSIAFELI